MISVLEQVELVLGQVRGLFLTRVEAVDPVRLELLHDVFAPALAVVVSELHPTGEIDDRTHDTNVLCEASSHMTEVLERPVVVDHVVDRNRAPSMFRRVDIHVFKTWTINAHTNGVEVAKGLELVREARVRDADQATQLRGFLCAPLRPVVLVHLVSEHLSSNDLKCTAMGLLLLRMLQVSRIDPAMTA